MSNKHILLAAMSLRLGGAETHIVELALALQRAGHRVSVVSAGGILADKLTACGIEHISCPLDVHSPATLLRCALALRRVFKRLKPDVVHAHARIPALACRLADPLGKYPLVTTVHGRYEVTPLLRFLTHWGEYQLAVSEDLKQYLLEEYRCPESKIRVTVNGIDGVRFSKGEKDLSLLEELHLPRESKLVVGVSRLDEDACVPAMYLAHHFEEIFDTDTTLIWVGGGSKLEELRQVAAGLNERLGRNAFVSVGNRADVERFLHTADAFVGVARSALEAICCRCPTVLFGNAGFGGAVTPEKLSSFNAHNFTCRGLSQPYLQDLKEAFHQATSLPKQALEDMGKAIAKHYSVDTMSLDAQWVYDRVISTRKRGRYDLVLCGYYGHRNLGDDILFQQVIKNLRAHRPQCRIALLMSHRAQYADILNELRVFAKNRFAPFSVMNSILRSRALVFGGGSLLQDGTSTKSLLYYNFLLSFAQFFRKKTVLYANGIGPIKHGKNLRRIRKTLSRATLITLRDSHSVELLESLQIPSQKVFLTADEVLTLSPKKPSQEAPAASYLVVSLREWKDTDPDFVEKTAWVLDQVAGDRDLQLVFVTMQDAVDEEISRKVSSLLHVPSRIQKADTAKALTELICQSSGVVAMRLHALVLGLLCDVPVCGICYDPKVDGFLQELQIPADIRIEQMDAKGFYKLLDEILSTYSSRKEDIAALRARAEQNARLTAKALWKGESL